MAAGMHSGSELFHPPESRSTLRCVAGTIHEDPSVLGFLGASLSEQLKRLAEWQLPPAGLLLLMNACESRCFFCANTGVTNPPPESITRFEQVATWLEENRALSVRRLCIVGTEPARHASFDPTLALARAVGFSEIEVMTSGLRLAEPGVVAQWAAHGVTTVAAPLYSPEAALHDGVVGRAAFEQTIRGLDAAHRAGMVVRIHTLALVRTLASLAGLARLVRERYGTQLSIAPVRPKETLFDYATESPSYEALEAALGRSRDVALVGFPRCVARDLPRDAALCITLYFRGQATAFPPACEPCLDRFECPGVVVADLTRARVEPRTAADAKG